MLTCSDVWKRRFIKVTHARASRSYASDVSERQAEAQLVREVDGRFLPSRVRGKQALIQRLTRLLLATHGFGRHRASTDDERDWTARLLDRLQAALEEARR